MEENAMLKKQLLFTIVIVATLVLSACTTATTPTTVVTEAPPVVAETQAPTAPTAVPTQVLPTAAPAQKTVATILWTQEFDSLNPLYTNMWFVTTTDQLWLNWAWEYNEQNEAHPVLVTELPTVENGGISTDGKTITFHITPGIVWSDGTPLTSADFKFTWEMATSPSNAVNSSYPYDKIDSIDTPDDATVVVNFTDPFSPWLATLWKGLLPSHILQSVYDNEGTLDSAEWNLAPTVGLGPYVFDTWESGSFARFVKNPNYWGKPAQIDEIFFRFVPDDAAQTTALMAGDGDMGAFIPVSDTPKLKDAGITIISEPSGYNEGMFFVISEEKGHPAMLDVRVRQALAMSIDRDSWIHYLSGITHPLKTIHMTPKAPKLCWMKLDGSIPIMTASVKKMALS
jgi:peptide/nickel transport system substrate-binding protein